MQMAMRRCVVQIERMTRTLLASALALAAITSFTTAADARVANSTDAAAAATSIDAPVTVQRVLGDKLISPDALTVAAIIRAEQTSVIGVFNVCIDSKGDVADINVLRSTRFPAYDAKLQRQIRTWKYQPVLLAGLPAPVCTKVTFVYQQKL
jgi:TonB family protein